MLLETNQAPEGKPGNHWQLGSPPSSSSALVGLMRRGWNLESGCVGQGLDMLKPERAVVIVLWAVSCQGGGSRSAETTDDDPITHTRSLSQKAEDSAGGRGSSGGTQLHKMTKTSKYVPDGWATAHQPTNVIPRVVTVNPNPPGLGEEEPGLRGPRCPLPLISHEIAFWGADLTCCSCLATSDSPGPKDRKHLGAEV